ncbi:MAG: TraX family protein [Lachnospiraceae bacterium]
MNEQKGLNANQLKLIAIIAMTIDHLTWTLWPGYVTDWWVVLLHIIGRLTAPIMWFFIAEGYHYTHDFGKYAKRLFILAVISHFAYNFCFGISLIPLKSSVFNQTGVVWSLAWGLMLLYINDNENIKQWQKIILTILICIITFPADWSCIAAMAVLFIGANRGSFKKQMMWMMLF